MLPFLFNVALAWPSHLSCEAFYAVPQLPLIARKSFERARLRASGRYSFSCHLFEDRGVVDTSSEAKAFSKWRQELGVEAVVTLSHFGEWIEKNLCKHFQLKFEQRKSYALGFRDSTSYAF